MLNQCIVVGRVTGSTESEGNLVLILESSENTALMPSFKVAVTIPKRMRANIEELIVPIIDTHHPLIGAKGRINMEHDGMIFTADKISFMSRTAKEINNEQHNPRTN